MKGAIQFVYAFLSTSAFLLGVCGLLFGFSSQGVGLRFFTMTCMYSLIFWSICAGVSWVRNRWIQKRSPIVLSIGVWEVGFTFGIVLLLLFAPAFIQVFGGRLWRA